MPAPDVQDFRKELTKALNLKDHLGKPVGACKWGVYAFYDYEGEPIYVGQTNEKLSTRIRRHLTNQRTDAVAMGVLDVLEVAQVEMWPLHNLGTLPASKVKDELNRAEYTVYLQAIRNSRFKAILNEKIPPVTTNLYTLPPSVKHQLVSASQLTLGLHPDLLIARRASTLARLTQKARERGEVSDGMRRVIVIQTLRLLFLSASRLAYAEGRAEPDPSVLPVSDLVGSVLEPDADGSDSAEDDPEE